MSTQRDNAVLNLILNPLLPSQTFRVEEESIDDEPNDLDFIKSLSNFDECQRHEVNGVKLAEGQQFELALVEFTSAVKLCPTNPSPYNNRAQVLRLIHRNDEAMTDLNLAIELCSGRRGRIACQAYVQRAMVHRLRGEEEEAKVDYEKAAALGSQFAKSQLIVLNPYAAMCNQMLGEVMSKLQHQQ